MFFFSVLFDTDHHCLLLNLVPTTPWLLRPSLGFLQGPRPPRHHPPPRHPHPIIPTRLLGSTCPQNCAELWLGVHRGPH